MNLAIVCTQRMINGKEPKVAWKKRRNTNYAIVDIKMKIFTISKKQDCFSSMSEHPDPECTFHSGKKKLCFVIFFE